jgi:dihydrofolate reductase
LERAEWNNSEVLHEIDPQQIQQLKSEPGKDILIYGSASIVQQLTSLGLIDEYQLLVHPVVLGAGKALFKDIQAKRSLKLLSTQTIGSAVVLLTYEQ